MRYAEEHGQARQVGAREATLRRRNWLASAAAIMAFSMLLGPALAAGDGAPPPPPSTPVNTAPPALTGTPAVGQTLSCSEGSWQNNPTSFTYAWLRDGAAIAGQTASTYIVQSADQGHSISCRVTAVNGGGTYTIPALAAGSYKVEFSGWMCGETGCSLNYLNQFYNGKASFTEGDGVSVSAGSTTPGINAEMHPGGQITGKVTDATTHAPLANVEVCANGPSNSCASTNASGEYTITGLATGSYKVNFSVYSCGENGCTRLNYLAQYYNGKNSYPEADAVAVTAPNTTSGINAEMHPGGQITGKVTDATTHAALANFRICVTGPTFSCASTNASGEYTVAGLSTGSYVVEFSQGYEGGGNYLTQYYNGKSSVAEAEAVSVTAGATTPGINAGMHTGGQITGKVTDAATHAPVVNAQACAYEASGGPNGNCASTNASGEYTVTGLATGSYKVEFTGFSCGENGCIQQDYLNQYYNNKASATEAEAVSVTAGATTPGINAAMHPGGHIAGKVTDAVTHAPLVNTEVCAIPHSGGLFRCASTTATGEYTITAMPTGAYTVQFSGLSCGENGCTQLNYLAQYYNDKASSAEADAVAVTAPNTTPGINAEMHPGGQITGRVTDASTHAPLANLRVCALLPVAGGGIELGGCASTTSPSGPASTASNTLSVPVPAVPNSNFTQAKPPKVNPATGEIDFFFQDTDPGTFTWQLSFKNSDAGFAASLADAGTTQAVVAKKRKKCKTGFVKHKGKCVHATVPFSSGSQSVPAGAVEIKVHASAKALKALKEGRTLHVAGQFTFQSALGGPPVTHTESVVVHGRKKHGKKHGKHKGH